MLHIGTSGWQYADWRGRFYPATLPQRDWLPYYAQAFTTVEVNNSFYRLPERETFAGWASALPPGFTMAVKMSRYLTHIRRLADPAEPVARFLDRAAGLGDHLGPVLLQLPPTLLARPEMLARTLSEFSGRTRIVVEPRHPSWFSEEIRTVLSDYGAALCWADRLGRAVTPLWKTADFGYLRLHEGRALPLPNYGVRALDAWLVRLAEGDGEHDDVYVYFNNDRGGAAVSNARTMARRAMVTAWQVWSG